MISTELDRYESQWGDSVYEERRAALQSCRPQRKGVTYSAQKRRSDIPRGICARGRARSTYRTFTQGILRASRASAVTPGAV